MATAQDPSGESVANRLMAKTADYDEIMEHIGQLGRFQLRHFLFLCFPALFPRIVVMSHTFTGAIPKYR